VVTCAPWRPSAATVIGTSRVDSIHCWVAASGPSGLRPPGAAGTRRPTTTGTTCTRGGAVMLSGDPFYGDDNTSGALGDDDPYAWPCDQCGAGPGEDCRPWCTSLADAQDDSAAELGILFSHTSEMVWPDLIGRAFPDVEAARAYGESITCAQGGIELAIMSRCASRPQWVEVGGHRADRAKSSPRSGPNRSPPVSPPARSTDRGRVAASPSSGADDPMWAAPDGPKRRLALEQPLDVWLGLEDRWNRGGKRGRAFSCSGPGCDGLCLGPRVGSCGGVAFVRLPP